MYGSEEMAICRLGIYASSNMQCQGVQFVAIVTSKTSLDNSINQMDMLSSFLMAFNACLCFCDNFGASKLCLYRHVLCYVYNHTQCGAIKLLSFDRLSK